MKKSLLLLVSVLFIGIGSYMINQNMNVLRNGIKTTGKVISLEVKDAEGEDIYCPKVQFKLSNGQTYDHQLDDCSNPPGYKVGDSIPLVYVENDLKTVRINSSTRLYYFPSIFILVGALVSMLTIWKWNEF